MKRMLVAVLLLWAAPAWADDLGCFTSGETVTGAFAQFTGTATSVVADVYDPDDLVDGTGYAAPTMTDLGGDNWGAANITAGATVGLHKVVMVATVGGSTVTLIDTFEVKAVCPLTATTAGRTLDVDTSGAAEADVTKHVGTAVATPYTAGIPRVHPNDGTGTGDLDTVAGKVLIEGGVVVGAYTAGEAPVGTSGNPTLDAAEVAADTVLAIIASVTGTADSGSTTTLVDAARTEADPDYWNNACVLFTSGTLAGQIGQVTSFTPATDTFEFYPALTAAVTTHTYAILKTSICATNGHSIDFDTSSGTIGPSQLEAGLLKQLGFWGTVTVAGSPAATTTSFASTSFNATTTDAYKGLEVECPGDGRWAKIQRLAPSTDEVFIPLGEACATAFSGTVAVRIGTP
jgi:hypothetical protein